MILANFKNKKLANVRTHFLTKIAMISSSYMFLPLWKIFLTSYLAYVFCFVWSNQFLILFVCAVHLWIFVASSEEVKALPSLLLVSLSYHSFEDSGINIIESVLSVHLGVQAKYSPIFQQLNSEAQEFWESKEKTALEGYQMSLPPPSPFLWPLPVNGRLNEWMRVCSEGPQLVSGVVLVWEESSAHSNLIASADTFFRGKQTLNCQLVFMIRNLWNLIEEQKLSNSAC